MKKILMGVCNLGNGHINREKLLIKLFDDLGYKICIVTANINDFCGEEYKNMKIIYCPVPWIATNNKGINFKECLKKYDGQDYYKTFLNMSIEVEEYFRGIPNIVVTDYEPNVAKYAYARNIKLINLEQQSKYLYLDNVNINDISLEEEKSRLLYFFPKSDLKIISSFFPFENKIKDNYICVPPIIDKEKLLKNEGNFVLVYCSPYGDKDYYWLFEKIMEMISRIKNLDFIVYSNYSFDKYKNDNIRIFKFNDNFKKDLSKCKFVISTSGHQLISECIYLDKPMLLTNFNTYEQNYNKKQVLHYNLGKEITNFNEKDIYSFIEDLDKYKNNIIEYKNKYYGTDWKDSIANKINEMINND